MVQMQRSIKDKALLLVSTAMIVFAISAGGLYVYSEYHALSDLQKNDIDYTRFAYNQIFERQRLNDISILNEFINTPGFTEAFVKRDRVAIVKLWNTRWESIKDDNIIILQLHEANGNSFVRMHEQSHYGDMIAKKRPMISAVHKSHIANSGFEVGIYGLAYRVAIPIIINGKYEGALEIGSHPKRLTSELHDLTQRSGFVLLPYHPLLKKGLYKKSLFNHWFEADIGVTPDLEDELKHAKFSVDSFIEIPNNFYQYNTIVVPLKNYKNDEVAKAVFIRNNTAKIYSLFIKVFFYGVIALLLALSLLYFLRRWLGILIDQLEKSNINLTNTLQQLDRYKNVLDHHNIVTKSDLNGMITYANDKFCEISGYTRDELIGQPHSIIRHPDVNKNIYKEMWELLSQKKIWRGILKNQHKDGSAYYLDTYIAPMFDEFGNITEYIAVRHDITELIEKRENLEHIAKTDALTGLGNRFALVNALTSLKSPALALIDVDHFSEINDFYGQRIGDEVIIELSKILKSITASKINLYRLGSDVFALLCDHINREAFLSVLHEISAQIRLKPLLINEKLIPIETTIGISFEHSDKIIATADMALTIGKKRKHPFMVYADEFSLEKVYENNIHWALKIKNAIENDRIIVYYQPIANNKTGVIEKYEALVRLIDEDATIISPYKFLDIAKKSKQYQLITRNVIEKSFKKFAYEDVSFSINLTIEDILSLDCNNYFFSMLETYNVKGRVVIELVESEGIENFEEVNSFITRAKKYDCKFAIDDFGTGYSNFEYLLRLKPDFIKIDGSIIKEIHKDEDSLEVVKTIVDFAKRTSIKTIAEFVCDEEIHNMVKSLDIDYSQGYHIGEPKAKLLHDKD
jgi:PAS domain S-box-containing protein/diguanylate cyclase (GGDEF)-like protein